MPTTVTFETATLADAIKRSARVAPSKSGHAFDTAAGIVMDIYPDEEAKCVLRATDVTVFLSEIVSVLDATGDEVRFRLPSMVLANVIGNLPITSGKTVTFTHEGDKVRITSDRMKATMILMDPTYYPNWDMFDPDKLEVVHGFGGKLAQVEWASDPKDQPPLCGVYLTGAHAIATDRYRLARVPCVIGIDSPITIPAGILGEILRPMGDVRVGVTGTTLQVAVDDYTQIQTVVYDIQYPAQIERVMINDYPEMVKLPKQHLLNMLNRASQFTGADRAPIMKLFIGKEEFAVMMENSEVGLLGDVVECPGSAMHKRTPVSFTPKNLIDGISKSPNETITIGYDPESPMRPFYIDGGGGYESWIVPRKDMKPEM